MSSYALLLIFISKINNAIERIKAKINKNSDKKL